MKDTYQVHILRFVKDIYQVHILRFVKDIYKGNDFGGEKIPPGGGKRSKLT